MAPDDDRQIAILASQEPHPPTQAAAIQAAGWSL
jgi:hypothetical protein